MRYIFFITFFLLGRSLLALEFEYQNYDWEAEPIIHELNDLESGLPAVIIRDDRAIQYSYNNDEELIQYYIEHKIIHVNDDAAIEEFNKVFIPMYNVDELIEIKARSISPQGVVRELDKDDIKELSNLENIGAYKLFAIEGLEKGGEVEYLYKLRKSPRYFGREIYQSDTRVRRATFILMSPSNLMFETKGYNGFPEGIDTLIEDEQVHQTDLEEIPALYQEKYASYTANLMRVEYKLALNLFSGKGRLLTWKDAAERYNLMIYTADKDDVNKVNGLVGKLKINKIKNTDDKIIALEKYLKANITFQEGAGDEFEKPSNILENNYANEFGFLRLMALLLNQSGIEHRLVLTTNRYKYRFDGSFDTWNYLDEAFFYFPHSGKFLVPHLYEYRYGLIPHEFIDNEALFIKPHDPDASEDIIAEIGPIPNVHVKNHYDDLMVKVSFNENMDKLKLNVRRIMAGYRAVFIQPFFDMLPPDSKTEFVEAILRSSGEDAVILDSQVHNTLEDDIYNELPYIIEGNIELSSPIERAGKKILFKVGELIGGQVEMYQDRPRQFDVDFEYPHKYLRVITLDIPNGYRIKGLEDININKQFRDENGDLSFGFLSSYKEEGNQLVITINEYYNTSHYSRSQL